MTSRLRTAFLVVLATVLAALLSPVIPAHAHDQGGVSVTITNLTPSSLGSSGTLRLAGEVTNDSDQPWSDVQAYLLIRPVPFVDRVELQDQAEIDRGFAGTRIADIGRFAELDVLDGGETAAFELTIPVNELPIGRATGVYPIGVQILGTDAEGNRSNDAIGRATTFIPLMPDDATPAQTTVVWPMMMPTTRQPDRQIDDLDAFIESMSTGGLLRHRLDAAFAMDPGGRGVLLDPALVEAANDVAEGDFVERELTEDEVAQVTSFRDDLIELGAEPTTWIVDYDRTDVLGLLTDPGQRRRLFGTIERATDAVIGEFGLSRRRVSWPSVRGVTDPLLAAMRERGDAPVIVSTQSAAEWTHADGVLLDRQTSGGNLPLLIADDITQLVPGDVTMTTLRQQVISSAALASLSGGEREALVLVDPSFDPGAPDTDVLGALPGFVEPQQLSSVTSSGLYLGTIGTSQTQTPITPEQVALVDEATIIADSLASATIDSRDQENAYASAMSSALSIRWRADEDKGLVAARGVRQSIRSVLESITVMGPQVVTLSSQEGTFPVTVSNGSNSTIRIGVRLDSSNPALDLPDVKPVEIAAGERRTLNVEVDLLEQNATTVTAHLTSPEGTTFGSSEEFIVRSSQVGAMLWWLMGGAGLLVVFALIRRFSRSRGQTEPSPAGELDD